MTVASWILLTVIAVAIIGVIVGGRKKQYYKIYMANNDVISAYRQMGDWWWRDSSTMMSFKLPDGRSLRIVKRWIIKVEADGSNGK